MDQLTELLCGDELLSAYELQSSGLAPSLLQVLSPQPNGKYFCCVLRYFLPKELIAFTTTLNFIFLGERSQLLYRDQDLRQVLLFREYVWIT